jgi:carboxypeptidase Q
MRVVVRSILVAAFCVAALAAQSDDEAARWQRVKQEAQDRSAVATYAFYLTDVFGHRLTGSSGFRKAAQWAGQTFRDLGLERVELVSVTTPEWQEPGWDYQRHAVRLIEPTFATLEAIPSPWSAPTNGRLVGEPIQFLLPGRSGLPVDEIMSRFRGRLKGKILLIADQIRPLAEAWRPVPAENLQFRRLKDEDLQAMREPLPPAPAPKPTPAPATATQTAPPRSREEQDADTRRFYTFLKEEGALAVLGPTIGDAGTIVAFGPLGRPGMQPLPPPMFNLSTESYNRILRLMKNSVPVRIEVELETHQLDERGHTNVLGEIRGDRKPDEVVLVGAHLDSWHVGTGATDNAGNCAVLIEAMRILKTSKLPLARTVRIALWAGEERGLRGSAAYVAAMKQRPGEKLFLYLNADGGSGKVRALQVQERLDLAPVAERWLAPFKAQGQGFVSIRKSRGSDQASFDQANLPNAVFVQDPVYGARPYHTNMDVYDYLVEDDLKQSAAVVAWVLYKAANEP